ncbi:MAG: hypothetical protein J2P21_18420 [Chloracidobacterium sp.]|nr:hypothetical protein [Chloracidobacterium sp.]
MQEHELKKAFEQSMKEFNGDPERLDLTGGPDAYKSSDQTADPYSEVARKWARLRPGLFIVAPIQSRRQMSHAQDE